ncbi:MAG: hypothetical protein LUQ13_03760 [Methanomicrobiales archaeon]|nr:hypothetical protein [Methanomicrobiales archaeon]
MFRILRDILGPKEGTGTIPFPTIPDWASDVEKGIRDRQNEAIAVQKKEVDAALRTIRDVIHILAAADIDEGMHKKLGKVVKNSLPLYLHAMEASLDRTLPEGGEEFYDAAVEVLKGCLRSTTNQGRYLRAAFPEEMKAIRQALDRSGRAVNAMTGILKTSREEMAPLGAIRGMLKELQTTADERSRLTALRLACARSNEERDTQINSLQASLQDLRNSDGFHREQERVQALSRAEEGGAAVERSFRNTATTIARVLERGEKAAIHQGASSDKALRAAARLLRDAGIPVMEDLETVLAPAVQAVRSFIADGTVPLKSQEERDLFAPEQDPCAPVLSSARHLQEETARVNRLRAEITASPILAEIRILEEKIARESQRSREDDKRGQEATESLVRIAQQEADLKERLEERIGTVMGKTVRIGWDV